MPGRSTRPHPAPTAPEHWRIEAVEADVAQLVVPADAQRERVFEVACTSAVSSKAAGAWHELRITVDGEHEWTRRAELDEAQQRDSLDYRFRRRVPVGQPLRIKLHSRVHGAQRLRMRIEAEEA